MRIDRRMETSSVVAGATSSGACATAADRQRNRFFIIISEQAEVDRLPSAREVGPSQHRTR
jgi:hypothetical protein